MNLVSAEKTIAVAPVARLDQIRTGTIALLESSGIRSAILKQVRTGAVWIGLNGLDGDLHAESFHGGAEKAILQYDSNFYKEWAAEFPDSAEYFKPGGFGENFVAAGMNETTVCVGDIVRVGGALLQVSEPRQPCFKLNHRFRQHNMSRRAQATGRTGWMYRVLEQGFVKNDDMIEVVERPLPEWPLARIQHYLYEAAGNLDVAKVLSELPLLSSSFRALFAQRVENSATEDWESRLSNGALVSNPVAWFEAEIAEIKQETQTVRSFRIVRADGQPLPTFDAGAHIDLRIANSLTRSYSLCRLPDENGYHIAVHRSPTSRGGSNYLHDKATVSEKLAITEPKNFFPLAAGASCHLMIAGGIGITPFLAMIEQLEAEGKEWELHYCARAPQSAAFHSTLTSRFPWRVHMHFTGGDRTERLDVSALLREASEGTHLYCCGSPTLMETVRAASSHWPDGHVHFESFGDKAASGTADRTPFIAVIASTGAEIEIAAESTLLEGLRASGFQIASSCEAGTCGTCRINYVAGDVVHRDLVLSSHEKKTCLISCVSRATSKITLVL